MTTPEENKKKNVEEMLALLDKSLESYKLALHNHSPREGNHIIHINHLLVDIEKKKVGANPLEVPKYKNRVHARALARKIKDGNGNQAQRENFEVHCRVAIKNLIQLKAEVAKRLGD